jgi:capsular exopolysaccharide synthesis family protein
MSEDKLPSGPAQPLKPPVALNVATSPHLAGLQERRGAVARGSPAGALSVSLLLGTLRHWWFIVLPLGLILGAVAAAGVYVLAEPLYEATAWLRLEDPPPYIAFPSQEESRHYVQTQIEVIHSPLVLGSVLSQANIASLPDIQAEESPIEWLAKEVRVRLVGQSELMTISVASRDPNHAAAIVSAVVKAYLALQANSDAERRQRIIELLEEEQERRARDVERLRDAVRTLTKQATGKDPFAITTETDRPANHPLADLQNRLVGVEVERHLLEAQVKAAEQSGVVDRVEIPESTLERALDDRQEVQTVKEQVLAKRALLGEYAARLAGGAEDPLYRNLEGECKQTEQLLRQTRESLRDPVRKELRTALLSQRQETMEKMREQLAALRLTEGMLREQCDTEVKGAVELSGQTLELQFKQGELARAEQVFERIASRVTALRTEQQAPSRVSLLKEASVPQSAIDAVPLKKMSLASLAALLLPFGVALVWERSIRRVSDAEQLEQDTMLPVVGEVSWLPIRARLVAPPSRRPARKAIRLFEESVDSLRTSLVLGEPLSKAGVLAVTSAVDNEGKTSVSVQLAVSIARASGQRTLLVDGDLRSPDIQRLFGARLEPGLAEVLAHACSVDDAIVSEQIAGLDLLPAGCLRTSPHQLFGNGAVRPLLEQLRSAYRYVIIDTPPVLSASEAMVLAGLADSCLICAMRDVSRIDQIQKTYDRLVRTGTRPAGIVLNGVPTKRYAYRYGNYPSVRS